MKDFSSKWCSWIQQIVFKGSVGIKVNSNIGHNFQTKKAVRHVDPLSPILFNLIVDILAILINRSKELGHFSGVIPHLVDGDLSTLQYVDDTIIFLENDRQGPRIWSFCYVHLSNYLASRSTFIKVNYSVMEMKKSLRKSTHRFLGVGRAPSLFII
jgi:hypothetical protein